MKKNQMTTPPPKLDNLTDEVIKCLGPLPKCIHGMIYNLCEICNKDFYYPKENR